MLVLALSFYLELHSLLFFRFGCSLVVTLACSSCFFLRSLSLDEFKDPLGIYKCSTLGFQARLAEGVHDLVHVLASEPLADPH